jgi:two-component system sensor histidine kinase PilS (NtrC family)
MPEPDAGDAGRERRQGDRRRGDRRQGDRRVGDRRRPPAPAHADESWFAAVGVGADSGGLGAESRFADGWRGGEAADSRFLSRQARRLTHGGATAFQRIFRTFVAARAVLGVALFVGLVLGQIYGVRPPTLPLVLAVAYVMLAVGTWWWSRSYPLPASRPGGGRLTRRAWLLTIGVDLAAFSALHLLEPTTNLNNVALLLLPLLMAGVLTPRLAALGTAAGVALLLLGTAGSAVIGGADPAVVMTPAGLAGIGFFVVTLLAGELAGRLAREELTARGSLELARQQARLNRLVIDEMGEGVLVIDRRGRVRTANPAARQLLAASGLAPPAPFGLDAMPAWRALAQAVDDAFRDAAWPEGGRDVRLEFGPGVVRTLRLRVRFTRRARTDEPKADGPTVEEDLAVLFVEDLRTALARTRQEKLAAMGRVSAAIAHEIRNPLAAIAQANALLREDALAADQHRLASIVADNVERLKRIVDDVLEATPGAAPPARALDAAALVDAVVREWAQTASIAPGDGSRLALAGLNAQAPVLFEPEALRRVLVNLLDNATRHASAQPGAIVLRLDTATPQRVQLVVASDGEPIAADVEPHLFEPFFSTRSRGSGLGLYICRELCERYGARIDYRQPPPGTRHRNQFVVTMRAAPALPTA